MEVHGSQGAILLGASPGAEIVSMNVWNLSLARDRAEITPFGATNKRYLLGLPDISGDIAGFYNNGTGSPSTGNTILLSIAAGDEPAILQLVPDRRDMSTVYEGPALLDGRISVNVNGAVTINSSFVASDNWTLP